MNSLADALTARANDLASAAFDAMYRDPFWLARFGERGKRFSREDGAHHVSYLVEALRTQHAAVLTDYARWLQSVLVTRGMCSLHLGDNFARLADAIRDARLPDAEIAASYLDQARRALARADEPARSIDLAIESLATDAARRMASNGDPELACRLELRTLASYLADAVALGDPAHFAKHVRWSENRLDAHPEISAAMYARLLDTLDAVCATLPSPSASAARDVLGAARKVPA